MAVRANDETCAGKSWARLTSYGTLQPQCVRRITVEGSGNLYLIPLDGEAGNGTLWGAVLAGQVVDQMCAGIGGSTNCSAVTVQF